ncbi:MAG: hypothetical protein RLZZ387_2867 [Chloroflexota bacterium]
MDDTQSSLCEEQRSRLAAYALGEGQPDSEARAHLEVCAACQEALREYRAVARVMPVAAPDAAPRPELRDRIVAAVAAGAVPRPAPAAARHRPGAAAWWASLAAMAALLVALLGWNVSLRAQVDTQAAQLAVSREGWQTVVVLLNDPDVRWYAVAGEMARGSLWAAPGRSEACLMVEQLPPLEVGQVYQVWLIDGEERTSGGVFEPRGGNAWAIIRSDEPVSDYRSVAVTVEPRGGSPAPTGPLVLAGDLTSPQAQ